MRRTDLEHVIRAAAVISGEQEFVVVGSSSLLASVPQPPECLRETADVDLYPLRAPEKAALIDGTIGELSAFHQAYSYYAQGVGPDTSTLPDGWQSRLVKLQSANTNEAIAYCLEPHDLAAAKLVANREKDLSFVAGMLQQNIVNPAVLAERVASLSIPSERAQQLKTWISRSASRLPRAPELERDPDGPDIDI